MAKAFKLLVGIFATTLFVLAARELGQADWRGALAAASAMDAASLGTAGLLIVASFLVFALYDQLAWIWHGGSAMPFSVLLRISFVATCAAMNVGVSALSGSALRLTLYGQHGVPVKTIAALYVRIVALFVVGWFIWLGIGLGFAHRFMAGRTGVPGGYFLVAGWGGAIAALIYVAVCARGVRFRMAGIELAAPSPRFALAHLAVSAADILTSAGVFHVLISRGAVSFTHATAMFMLANTAGMVSQVPGGLGVFEWTALELSGPAVGDAHTLAGLLVFRLCFFWVPLLLALPFALHACIRGPLSTPATGQQAGPR